MERDASLPLFDSCLMVPLGFDVCQDCGADGKFEATKCSPGEHQPLLIHGRVRRDAACLAGCLATLTDRN